MHPNIILFWCPQITHYSKNKIFDFDIVKTKSNSYIRSNREKYNIAIGIFAKLTNVLHFSNLGTYDGCNIFLTVFRLLCDGES